MSFNSPQPTNFTQTRCRGAFYDNESTPNAAEFKMCVLRTPGKQYQNENSSGAQSGSNTTQTPKPFMLEQSAEQTMAHSQPFEPIPASEFQHLNQSDLNTPVKNRVVSEESPMNCDRKVASKFVNSSPMQACDAQVSSWECNARRSRAIGQNMMRAPAKFSAQDRFKAAASPQVSRFDSPVRPAGLFSLDPFKDNGFKATAMAAQPKNEVQASSFLFSNLDDFESEPLRLSPQSKSQTQQEQDDIMMNVDTYEKNSRTGSTSSMLDTAISNTHIGSSLHNECKPFYEPSPFDALDQHFQQQFDTSSPFEPVQDIPRASNFR